MRLISSRPWGLWATTSTDRLAEIRNTQPVIASWLSRFARSAQRGDQRCQHGEGHRHRDLKAVAAQPRVASCGRLPSSWCSGKHAAGAQRHGNAQGGCLGNRGPDEHLIAGHDDHPNQRKQQPDQPAHEIAVVKQTSRKRRTTRSHWHSRCDGSAAEPAEDASERGRSSEAVGLGADDASSSSHGTIQRGRLRCCGAACWPRIAARRADRMHAQRPQHTRDCQSSSELAASNTTLPESRRRFTSNRAAR